MSPGSGGVGSGDTYYCNRGQRGLHGRPTNIAESKLMPWVKAEADRLVMGVDEVITPGEGRYDDSVERQSLEALRGKVSDAVIAAGIADLDAKRAEHGERAQLVHAVPPRIDWDHWEVEDINRALRAMFLSIQLGPDLLPVEAEWRVPEWRRP